MGGCMDCFPSHSRALVFKFRTATKQVQEEYNEGIVLKVSAFRGAFRWMVVNVFLPLR